MTAEFVVALPALLLVVAMLVGALHAQYANTELNAVTGRAARAYLVSGKIAAEKLVHSQIKNASISFTQDQAVHCVTVSRTVNIMALLPSENLAKVCLYG